MTTRLSIALVGMAFRPPAKEVLSVLPLGMPLILHPEPDNSYDPNAIAVLVDLAEYPVARMGLLQAVVSPGWDASELCAQGPFHLGYLAASGGKPAKGGPGNAEALLMASAYNGFEALQATLGSAPEGYAVVNIEARD